ncbi:MAG TPA: tRNA lysidine(34) synthetase TilS [Chloroflexota bacterium]|nr:tRNA lysidine(34) synthetase TilS [Chloroflexota bacterium]
MNLEATIREEFERVGNDWRGATLVVAVSGGADSLALLDALIRNAGALDVALHVAHVDHGLRPDSELDALYVAEIARTHGLPCTQARIDVAERARRSRKGIEETARQERYRFLGQLARQHAAAAVVTGHTADDQVETILMHVIRGSSARGLRGMANVTPQSDADSTFLIWRPLLGASRQDTREYCRCRNINWREDPSNLDLRFTRNRVRHELLPMLRSFNPRFDKAIQRLSANIRADDDLLNQLAMTSWSQLVLSSDEIARRWGPTGGFAFNLAGFLDLAPPLQRRLLVLAAEAISGGREAAEALHIESTVQRLPRLRVNATIEWPGGVRIIRGHDAILIRSESAQEVGSGLATLLVGDECPLPLAIPGVTVIPSGYRIIARRVDRPCNRQGPGHVDLAEGRLLPPLVVRRRKPGDRYRPAGGTGSRKLSDLLIDAKVPRALRDGLAVVEDQLGIVWVEGLRAAERASGPGEVICLTLESSPDDGEER